MVGDLCALARRVVRILLRDLGHAVADGAVRIAGADHAAAICVFGAPGLLFDQEYGLLAYAPVYILAGTGLCQMWRAGGELRRQAIEITFIFAALLVTVGAFGIWWGGSAAPARPIASGLLLLMLPIAAAFRSAPAGSPRRAAQHLLLWIGVGIAITLAFAQDGLLINNGRDGTSALLDFWSPRWELWTLAPSFIAHEAPTALLTPRWWLVDRAPARPRAVAMARAAGPASRRSRRSRVRRRAARRRESPCRCCRRRPADAARSILGARARLAALDGFDCARAARVDVYDPLRKARRRRRAARLTLAVAPGQRPDPQPVRVHSQRPLLAAGRATIDVDVQFDADRAAVAPMPLSLQIGRNGPPLQTWTVHAATPAHGRRRCGCRWMRASSACAARRARARHRRRSPSRRSPSSTPARARSPVGAGAPRSTGARGALPRRADLSRSRRVLDDRRQRPTRERHHRASERPRRRSSLRFHSGIEANHVTLSHARLAHDAWTWCADDAASVELPRSPPAWSR